MSTAANSVLHAKTTMNSERHVTLHDVGFVMKVVAFANGPAHEDNSALYSALSGADEELYRALPRAITNCHYIDQYEVECDRLEVYQPEFDHDDSLPDGTVLYRVSVAAPHELALTRGEATAERPLTLEQLLDEVPAALQALYAKAGVQLELHRATWFKRYESSDSGVFERT